MTSTIGELRGIKSDMEIEWIINDFSIFSAVIDTKYMSPSFDFAGASWSLWIFPNGTTKYNSEGKVECYLVKITGPSITLSYILGLKKADGNLDEKCKQTMTFKEIEGGFGCLKIISTSELLKRKSDLAPNNVFTIICKITGEKVNIDSSKWDHEYIFLNIIYTLHYNFSANGKSCCKPPIPSKHINEAALNLNIRYK